MALKDTTLVTNLLNKGELPVVPVEIETKTIVSLCVGLVIVVCVYFIVKKLIG